MKLVARLALASAAVPGESRPPAVGFATHEAAAIICGRMQEAWLET